MRPSVAADLFPRHGATSTAGGRPRWGSQSAGRRKSLANPAQPRRRCRPHRPWSRPSCRGIPIAAPWPGADGIRERHSLFNNSHSPAQPRYQCRGFFFAGAVMAKEAAILSTSMFVATSSPERWLGKEGTSSTPSSRSILATAARRSCPSQTAAAASKIEPLASLILSEYRRVFRMCEVKDGGWLGVQ